MKYYLWLAIAGVVVANASDNPFNLKDNFKKIDKNEQILFDTLKEAKKVDVTKKTDIHLKKSIDAKKVIKKPLKVVAVAKEQAPKIVKKELKENRTKASEIKTIQKAKEIKKVKEIKKTKKIQKTKEIQKVKENTTLKTTPKDTLQLKDIVRKQVAEYERQRAKKLNKNSIVHSDKQQKAKEVIVKEVKKQKPITKTVEPKKHQVKEVKKVENNTTLKAISKSNVVKKVIKDKKQTSKNSTKHITKSLDKEKIKNKKAEQQKPILKKIDVQKPKIEKTKKKAKVIKIIEIEKRHSSNRADINLTQEALDAQRKADLEYQAAVEEVSKEDN